MQGARTKLKIRLAQLAPRLGDVERNFDQHRETLAAARGDGVDLLVFPELSLTGYYLRDLSADVAMSAEDKRILELAEQAGRMQVVVGFVERGPRDSLFCSSAWMAEGRVLHLHRKVYLPTYGMFDEGRYLTAGGGAKAFEVIGWRGGLLICEDLWHLSLPLLLSRQGCDVLVVTACSPARGVTDRRLASQSAWKICS